MKHNKSTIGIKEATWGLLYTLKTQTNFKIQVFFSFMVFVLAVFFKVTLFEWLILLTVISMVLIAEVINTALEATVDLTVSDLNPIARIVKDTAAGAVLLASFFALIVGLLIFVPYLQIYYSN